MPHEQHRFTALIQRLENDLYLAEVLFFPEVSRLHNKGKRLMKALRTNTLRILKSLPPMDISRRHPVRDAEVRKVSIELESPTRTCVWREPVILELSAVFWSHEDETFLAYIPCLGIEVVAQSETERETMLQSHIKAALMRDERLSLSELIYLSRYKSLTLKSMGVPTNFPSLRQAAQRALDDQEKEQSVLKEVATNLSSGSLPEAHEVDTQLLPLIDALTDRHPRSLLLVGPSGVGKTALIHELVRRRELIGLENPVWATSGSRLVAGMTGFGMWQERCQNLVKEAKRKKAFLHVGNLMELMEVGKSANHSQGIAAFLRPYIVRGELTVLAECTPEQKTIIERLEPQLFHAFDEVALEEPDRDRGLALLTSESLSLAISSARDESVQPITDDALARIDALHRRYATYSAYPGRPLRFLRNLLTDRAKDECIDSRQVTASFSRETGLPLFILDESEPLDLSEARKWFSERVIGQECAVDLIVDLMATIKAQLTRPRKPIASLMFIGPTGVGKTEMAKALAEYLFGSRERLTRFDMSEYSDPYAVQRLIGGLGAKEGLLTAKVREQPFSVVLLDEIEKAHSQFFDLLLQVLGEGRLTDSSGRLADFSNSVVIMTSNLGAASYQQGSVGFATSTEGEGAKEHFEREVQKAIRPELFNRIDRIVPFDPLGEAVILEITHRQLEMLQSRDGIRYRGVDLQLTPEVHQWLAKKGFDVRYGARPLKRAIEKELLAPLSEKMNAYTTETPLRVSVEMKNDQLDISVKARTDETGRQVTAHGAQQSVIDEVHRVVHGRRQIQRLERCSAVLQLRNEIYRLEWVERRLHKGKRVSATEGQRLAKLSKLKKLTEAIQSLREGYVALEDSCLTQLYSQQEVSISKDETAQLQAQWEHLLESLYLRQFEKPNEVTVGIFGEPLPRLFTLTMAYVKVAEQIGGQVELWQFVPSGEKKKRSLKRRLILDRPTTWWQSRVRARETVPLGLVYELAKEETLLESLHGSIGFALVIKARAAYPMFSAETGSHQFNASQDAGRCLVDVSQLPMLASSVEQFYHPPEGVERKGSISNENRRRIYHVDRQEVEDLVLRRRRAFYIDQLEEMLVSVMREKLKIDAENLLFS